jgi:hypothetical protein
MSEWEGEWAINPNLMILFKAEDEHLQLHSISGRQPWLWIVIYSEIWLRVVLYKFTDIWEEHLPSSDTKDRISAFFRIVCELIQNYTASHTSCIAMYDNQTE